MKLARGLERRLERLVDGLAARIFRGSLHPVELANRLIREADLAIVENRAGPTIPNVYRLRIATEELPPEDQMQRLSSELGAAVAATAAERGWRLEGPVYVQVVADQRLAAGSMAVETDFHAAELPAWAHLEELKGSRRLPLRHVRCLVGRAVDVDVNLPVQEVSRYHALIWREASGVWVADLGSVNGTYADGRPARDPVAVHDGSVLAFGPAAFTFRAG